MKRLLQGVLVCLLVVALAPTASLGQSEAQDAAKSTGVATGDGAAKPHAKKSPGARGRSSAAAMKAALGLDDEQVKKVQAIKQKYAAEMKTIRTSTKKGPERTRQLKETALKRTAELRAVMTPEQLEKYEKSKPAGRAKRPGAQKKES